MKKLLFLLSFCLPLLNHAQTVSVGKGSYTLTFPGTDVAGRNGYPSGSPYLIDSLKSKPVPTNDWWSSKVKEAHCANLFNYPLTLKTVNQGLVTSYIPWGVISDIEPIVVGVSQLNHGSPYISEYGDWHIAMEWKSGQQRFQARVAMGNPMVYYQKDSANTARIQVNSGTVSTHGDHLIIENAYNGADFVVYAPAGSSWSQTGSVWTSNLNGQNYWSMMMLPHGLSNLKASADSFERFAFAEPIRTQVQWNYNPKTNRVTTEFKTQVLVHEGTDSSALMGLLPHQWAHAKSSNLAYLNVQYPTVRGELKLLGQNGFEVEHSFKGILPTLPYVDYLSDGFDPSKLSEKIQQLQFEGLSTWTDSYNEGQVMNRLIQTARIAHEMGQTEAVNSIKATIKKRLEDWLSYESGEVAFLFHYNKTWSAMLGYPAGHGQDNNINDHHFHWGYFIHAASFLEEFEPGWAKDYGDMINLLVRDAASPNRSDTLFPFLRNFNPYSGHCWANGFASFPQGNDQESTSESMQFNSSLIHWGMLTGNDEIRDLGIYLYCTEQSAIDEYWFDKKDRNFSSTHPYSSVSRVWGNSYDNGTFWTGDIAASYGIELYPIHGGSFYLAHDSAYTEKLWAEMAKNTGILSNQANDNLWHDVYWSYLAFKDPKKALQLYDSYPNRNLKFGISDAQTYHWLHALNALGRLQPQVTADHPLAMVFHNGKKRIYAAKNYGPDTLLVRFSDQYELTVPPRRLITSLDGDIRAYIGSDFAQLYKGTAARIYFDSLNVQPDSVQWVLNSKRVSTQVLSPWQLQTDDLDAGIYRVYSRVYKAGEVALSNIYTLVVGEQTPYGKVHHAVPGTFQSGHFDSFEGGSGQGISYLDFSPQNLGNFRTTEAADAASDPNEGAILTWIDAGEWAEYSVNIASDGLYNLNLRYSNGNAGSAGKIDLYLDGQWIGRLGALSSTGKWETFGSKEFQNIPMRAGKRILQARFEESGYNLSSWTFTRQSDFANARPLAHAGGNKSHPEGLDSLKLDGSKSQAGSLGYLHYQWKQMYGPNKLDIEAANTPYAMLRGLVKGVYKVELRVSDSLHFDAQTLFVFVGDGQNVAPEISLIEPNSSTSYWEGQSLKLQALADDFDGQIAAVYFSLDQTTWKDSIAPYSVTASLSSGLHSAYAWAVDDKGAVSYSDTVSFSALSPIGEWVLEKKAAALAVGPDAQYLLWWSNSTADIQTRSCLFDDVYSIQAAGVFQNKLGNQTWLEGWQNNGKEACGTPLAPHDGMQTGSWYIDSNNQFVLVGSGQFLGLPKATNNGELGNGATEPSQRRYTLRFDGQTLVAGIDFGAGYWQFRLVKGSTHSSNSMQSSPWRIYPNPGQSRIQIDGVQGFLQAQLFSLSGQLYLSSRATDIDVSALPAGTYLIRIESQQAVQSQIWVKTP